MPEFVTVVKTVEVTVNVNDYVAAYGPDPYDDGRSIGEAIEVDVEQWLESLNEVAPIDIDIESRIA